MPAVAFVSPKGGAGKTTAALLLALGLAERGETVAVIDSDPNKPFVHWAALPGKPPEISVHPAPTLYDVRDALRSRTYACDVDVVLEVVDERAPWNTGRWRLTGDRTDAACLRTRAAADLVLRPEDLGAAYLGGTPLRARPVEERTPGSLDAVSTAFGPLGAAPWCPLVF